MRHLKVGPGLRFAGGIRSARLGAGGSWKPIRNFSAESSTLPSNPRINLGVAFMPFWVTLRSPAPRADRLASNWDRLCRGRHGGLQKMGLWNLYRHSFFDLLVFLNVHSI